MEFMIDDPAKLITIAAYARVLFWDFVRDLPIFRGFVESATLRTAFGQQGREIEVNCYGIEALLDQYIIPALSLEIQAGSNFEGAIVQRLVATLPVRAGRAATFTWTSTQQLPIQDFGAYFTDGNKPIVVADGLTPRAAYEAWYASASYVSVDNPAGRVQSAFTIDFWEGVRLFFWGQNAPLTSIPQDYAALTITESSNPVASSLTWVRDTNASGVVTQVYVNAGAGLSRWVTGDTTQGPGQGYVSDTSMVFDFQVDDAAGAILGRRGSGTGRGTLVLEDIVPTNVHPGSLLTITNAALGWSAKQFIVSQISKRFTATGQTWTVTFFDRADTPNRGDPSAIEAIRSLTRAVTN
jgi:hypothetical protein